MTSKIMGNALYLELVPNPELSEDDRKRYLGWQGEGVKQAIIFPAVKNESGKLTTPVIMSRNVTKYSPRAQWDFSQPRNYGVKPRPLAEVVSDSESDSYLKLEYYSRDEWSALGSTAISESYAFSLELMLIQIMNGYNYAWEDDERVITANQVWQVREGKPIAVEFTEDDLKMVLAYTTPQAVIRRINKVRGTLDKFPEKLVSFA